VHERDKALDAKQVQAWGERAALRQTVGGCDVFLIRDPVSFEP
jgi:hypothetical protein